MKKLVLMIALSLALATASFAADKAPTEPASNSPEWFLIHHCDAPDVRTADIPGTVKITSTANGSLQEGSSLTPNEAFQMYCGGAGGAE